MVALVRIYHRFLWCVLIPAEIKVLGLLEMCVPGGACLSALRRLLALGTGTISAVLFLSLAWGPVDSVDTHGL